MSIAASDPVAPVDGVRRMVGWASAALTGTALRLLLLVGSTALLGRWLPASDFGMATLVLSVLSVMLVFAGGIPFEDALAQKRKLTRRDLGAAIGASWALGAVLSAGATLAAFVAGGLSGSPDFALLLGFGCVTMVFQAPLTIMTAYARRRRRFGAIAAAEAGGAALGSASAIAVALVQPGAEALIAQRVAMAAGGLLVISLSLGLAILPRFSLATVRQNARYSAYALSQKLAEDFSYLATNYLVGALFGLAALGQLNMAMRIVEPIRGATLAISHNLAFPHIRAASGDPAAVVARVCEAASVVAFVTAPALLGLAAVSPLVVQILVGPGWEQAGYNAMALAFGASLMLPFGMVITGAAAIGRPELLLRRRIVGLLMLAVALPLLVLAQVREIVAGLSRAAVDGAEAMYALVAHRGCLGGTRGHLAAAALRPWSVAFGMAVAVGAIGQSVIEVASPALTLAVALICGVTFYCVGVALAAPRSFALLQRLLRRG